MSEDDELNKISQDICKIWAKYLLKSRELESAVRVVESISEQMHSRFEDSELDTPEIRAAFIYHLDVMLAGVRRLLQEQRS